VKKLRRLQRRANMQMMTVPDGDDDFESQAEVFLQQATLLSDPRGSVEEQMRRAVSGKADLAMSNAMGPLQDLVTPHRGSMVALTGVAVSDLAPNVSECSSDGGGLDASSQNRNPNGRITTPGMTEALQQFPELGETMRATYRPAATFYPLPDSSSPSSSALSTSEPEPNYEEMEARQVPSLLATSTATSTISLERSVGPNSVANGSGSSGSSGSNGSSGSGGSESSNSSSNNDWVTVTVIAIGAFVVIVCIITLAVALTTNTNNTPKTRAHKDASYAPRSEYNAYESDVV